METYKSRASSLGIVLSLLAAACETTSGAPPPDVPQDVRVIVDTPPSDVFDASAPNDLGPLLDAPMPGDGADATTDGAPVDATAPAMTPEELVRAQRVYFDRCAGCHGALRAGATGPNLQPSRTLRIGTARLRMTIANGTPGGMPGWVRTGLMTAEEADLMARYIQHPPPTPPPRPMEMIRASWQLNVPVAERPTRPMTTRNWENFFGVILRDAGQVAIIDGDNFELVSIVPTGFAVHILRSSTSGRYFYAIGRDGRVTLIDLWTPTPTIDAVVQGCSDARSVEASRFPGYEDRLLIEGCYWPPQYVVFDGATLEPRGMQNILSDAVTGEHLDEVRVASIVASRFEPVWAVSLKESGFVALVDYSQPEFPVVSRIPAVRFLHDGGWDHTGRYFMISANASNRVAVVDVRDRRFVTSFTTGLGPHPGRAANWQDPTYGWVNAVAHMGQARLAIYGADPEGSPENAWRVVRNVALPSAGSLFIKTHPNSPWVWIDSPVSTEPNAARRICVYSKARGVIDRCWFASDHGQTVHFEYNRAGTQVWVSVWDRQGELVVYDDRTLAEVTRIRGDWLVTPTGKFNVYNTAHDVY
jgi:nitrite reductase (NO-forming)/hydroxylamine reductase